MKLFHIMSHIIIELSPKIYGPTFLLLGLVYLYCLLHHCYTDFCLQNPCGLKNIDWIPTQTT
jgi:hypothetical protein